MINISNVSSYNLATTKQESTPTSSNTSIASAIPNNKRKIAIIIASVAFILFASIFLILHYCCVSRSKAAKKETIPHNNIIYAYNYDSSNEDVGIPRNNPQNYNYYDKTNNIVTMEQYKRNISNGYYNGCNGIPSFISINNGHLTSETMIANTTNTSGDVEHSLSTSTMNNRTNSNLSNKSNNILASTTKSPTKMSNNIFTSSFLDSEQQHKPIYSNTNTPPRHPARKKGKTFSFSDYSSVVSSCIQTPRSSTSSYSTPNKQQDDNKSIELSHNKAAPPSVPTNATSSRMHFFQDSPIKKNKKPKPSLNLLLTNNNCYQDIIVPIDEEDDMDDDEIYEWRKLEVLVPPATINVGYSDEYNGIVAAKVMRVTPLTSTSASNSTASFGNHTKVKVNDIIVAIDGLDVINSDDYYDNGNNNNRMSLDDISRLLDQRRKFRRRLTVIRKQRVNGSSTSGSSNNC